MRAVPEDSVTIDRKERIYRPYQKLDYRSVIDRVKDFREAIQPFDVERAKKEASACIGCPHPAPCYTACPVHNDIPSAMWYAEQGDFIKSASIFRQTSCFPEICGRVCPQEQLCEGSCVRNANGEPVHIGAIEAFVTDYERIQAPETITTSPPTGKRVAIIGAGPSGLACAEQVIKEGHAVTIFEANHLGGGLLIYGIPGFKLSPTIPLAKLKQLEEAGVTFVYSSKIGRDHTIEQLFADGYSAVYIAIGAGVEATMDVPGEDLDGVFQGNDFLIRANVDLNYLPASMASRPQIGDRVAIIGGGDTASDCLRTSLRMGAKEVTCVYRRSEREMPGGHKDRDLARQEGAQYLFLTQPIRFIGDEKGHLTAIECVRMELGAADQKGRRRPIPIEGSNFILELDTIILAIGFWPYPNLEEFAPGLKTSKAGLIMVDPETGATSNPNVFAGGDAVNGPDLVVTAMAAGRRAAQSIIAQLQSL